MAHDSSSREITSYSFLVAFANDDLIDENELAFIKRLALRDGQVDDDERRVLGKVFARAEGVDLSPQVRHEIEQFKKDHGIP